MKTSSFVLVAAMMAPAMMTPAAWANDAQQQQGAQQPVQAGAFAANEGEIRKVDKEQGKLTIKHGALLNLDMPAMTMVFRVKDPAMLEQVSAGDKVKLQVEKVNGALTVTDLAKQ
ncbi:MAG: hypothetical protein JWP36_162 [Paucimonas sp.]|nr:hypothetical protein [Paucimonas sp.]